VTRVNVMQKGKESSELTESSDSGLGLVMFDALLAHFAGHEHVPDLDPTLIKAMRLEFESSEFFGQDMRHLWIMLESIVTKSMRDPGSNEDRINLLNLACGYCEEGAVLPAFWGRSGKKVYQFSIDLRDAEIDKAKRRYVLTEKIFREAGLPDVREFSENFKGVEFIADDAINLAGYGQIPSQFNVIFIRHQNLWHDRSTWQRIYDFALSRLTDDGILVITSYFDREHFLALELIKMLGGNVLVSERNYLSRELSYPGKSIDRHVAAISKEK
jgi:hypothetical protein